MEQFLKYLLSTGKGWTSVEDFAQQWEAIKGFDEFRDLDNPAYFGVGKTAAAFLDEGKGIDAIKQVRRERKLGVKEAKDLVDAAREANPKWRRSGPPRASLVTSEYWS